MTLDDLRTGHNIQLEIQEIERELAIVEHDALDPDSNIPQYLYADYRSKALAALNTKLAELHKMFDEL